MLCDLGDVLSFGTAVELSVSVSNATIFYEFSSNCYAGVIIDGDAKTIKKCTAAGNYILTVDAPFIIGGTGSDVWVERTITGGSLTFDGIGASRVACTTPRKLECLDTDSSFAKEDAIVTCDFYDASSGGNLLGTAVYNLSANYTIL